MNKEKSLGFFIIVMVVLGVVQLLNKLLLVDTGASGIIGFVLDIVGLVFIVWAGRSSKMVSGHPAGRGALMGAVYAVIAEIPLFFAAEFSATDLHSGGMSADQANNLADMVNSTGMHVLIYIILIMWLALLGLIISAIGGATIKKPRD